VPVLHDIGVTVGLGAILALAFSAILNRRDEAGGRPDPIAAGS